MIFLLGAASAFAQGVTMTVSRPAVAQLLRGQTIIDIVSQTRHPAYLEPQALKTPDGVRIVASTAAADNARTCPRAAPSGSECRQIFRVTLDTLPRCEAGGDYQALLHVGCWPGTAPSLCKPGIHQFDFKVETHNACQR